MNRKPYLREISKTTWYFSKWREILHMVHELSSIFIGAYAVLILLGLKALTEGEEAYQVFLERLASPISLGFHWLALVFTLYHSISWFRLTPKALPLQIGKNFVPGYVIAAVHFIAWICVSLFILFITGVFAND